MRTRRSSRTGITATGSCRTAGGATFEIALADLSPGGCRIDDPAGRIAVGEQIRLTIAGSGPHIAEVAWRRGTRVGIEFRQELPEQVMRQIAAAGGGDKPRPADPAGSNPRRIL